MTSDEMNLEVLKLALDIARDNIYARRAVVKDQWERRTGEQSVPGPFVIDTKEVEQVYHVLRDLVK